MSNTQKLPDWHVTAKMRSRARSLRQEATRAERTMWSLLRAHRLNGASFRRQTPIGPYIIDFVWYGSKLIIEVDGGQHFETQHEKRDARRDAFLTGKGFRVLRFSNLDVLSNREGVWTIIADALTQAPPPPQPSPASGGGSTPAQASLTVQP